MTEIQYVKESQLKENNQYKFNGITLDFHNSVKILR